MVPYDCVIINLCGLSYLKLDSLLLLIYAAEFLIQHGPKLAQQWLVCAPLGIQINNELMLSVTI